MYMHTNFSSFYWLGCYMLYMWVRHGRLLMRVLMMDMSYDTCVFGITVFKATQNLCLRYNRKTVYHRYTYMCVITCFFVHVCKRVFFFLRYIISQQVVHCTYWSSHSQNFNSMDNIVCSYPKITNYFIDIKYNFSMIIATYNL